MTLQQYVKERQQDSLYEAFECSHIIIKDRLSGNGEFKLSIESESVYQNVLESLDKLEENELNTKIKSSQFLVTLYSESTKKFKTISCLDVKEVKQIVEKVTTKKDHQLLKESNQFLQFGEGVKSIRGYEGLKSELTVKDLNESLNLSEVKIDGLFYL